MIILFSDLDGTLLDHDTYSYASALPGIILLAKERIPLIMVSSKTFDEMKLLHGELGLDTPFIFENGGGLALPGNGGFDVRVFGPGIDGLRRLIPEVESVIGSAVRPIIDMTAESLAETTGLPLERAALAMKRKTSIPFLLSEPRNVSPGDIESFNRSLAGKNAALTRGGRFFHLIAADSGKGAALDAVIGLYAEGCREIVTAAVGDSENDISMLERVDRPFIVRKKNGSAVDTGIARITVTEAQGPAGFTEAVEKLVKGAFKE
ncbi:MAG TPA: HAD hydrolase family protein [Spirochaetota bacterium]|nr:HAD hydrolase family protein [Spirochaetota bacterium]